MKQLTIISGKGGTGKTTLVAAFASLAENCIMADCDVDAPDLHIILKPEVKEKEIFTGSKIASKDDSKCNECGKCEEFCRFDAIKNLKIQSSKCEGCGLCVYICPKNAINLENRETGYLYTSETRFGPLVHAELNMGEGASGKLVSFVRGKATTLAENLHKDLIIVDGSPGIGCPVIASITGIDMALIVTEPTISGLHDFYRILKVTRHFNVFPTLCINKHDINLENSKKIEEYCSNNNIPILGKIPYDEDIIKAMLERKNVIEYSPDGKASTEIKKIWKRINYLL